MVTPRASEVDRVADSAWLASDAARRDYPSTIDNEWNPVVRADLEFSNMRPIWCGGATHRPEAGASATPRTLAATKGRTIPWPPDVTGYRRQSRFNNAGRRRPLYRTVTDSNTPADVVTCVCLRARRIVAVAHTILVIEFHMLKHQQAYHDLGTDYFDRRNSDQLKRSLVRRLEGLGLKVTICTAHAPNP